MALLALALIVGLGLVARWGHAALSSSRAQAAADAAALASFASTGTADLPSARSADQAAATAAAEAAGGRVEAFDVTVGADEVRVCGLLSISAASGPLRPLQRRCGRPRTSRPTADSYTAKRGRRDIRWRTRAAARRRADAD